MMRSQSKEAVGKITGRLCFYTSLPFLVVSIRKKKLTVFRQPFFGGVG
jgi:hypothetical protein